jgi:hypothetical protein
MNKRNYAGETSRVTKVEKLLTILSDGRWHSTKELVHRVGHTFSFARFKVARLDYFVEKRKHTAKPRQYQYRLAGGPGYRPE